MANDGFIEFLSPNALAELKKASEIVDALALKIEKISNFKAPTTPGGVNSASKQIIDDLKAQEAQLKAINAELIREEKLKQQVLATETKQANATKANIAQREAQRKASLAQQQSDEKAARAAERSALANQRLNDAYGQLNKRRNEAARTLQNLIASETASNAEIRKAQREFDILNGKVKKADQAIGKLSQANNGISNLTSGVTSLMSAFGISTGIYLAVDIAKNIFETTKQLQSLDMALKNVSGSQLVYQENMNFISKVSDDFGIEIKGLQEQFTQFWVASKDKLSADEIRNIFKSISKAGAAMGLSVESQQSAFLALQQMMSKGTVQAEELKKQLGNALPGAFNIMATALGVTEKKMMEMMKAGNILSEVALPKFAKALEKAYGIEQVERIDTIISAQERLANTWTRLIRSITEGDGIINDFIQLTLRGWTKELEAVIWATEKLGNLTKKLFGIEDSDKTKKSKAVKQAISDYEEMQSALKKANEEREKEVVRLNKLQKIQGNITESEKTKAQFEASISEEKIRKLDILIEKETKLLNIKKVDTVKKLNEEIAALQARNAEVSLFSLEAIRKRDKLIPQSEEWLSLNKYIKDNNKIVQENNAKLIYNYNLRELILRKELDKTNQEKELDTDGATLKKISTQKKLAKEKAQADEKLLKDKYDLEVSNAKRLIEITKDDFNIIEALNKDELDYFENGAKRKYELSLKLAKLEIGLAQIIATEKKRIAKGNKDLGIAPTIGGDIVAQNEYYTEAENIAESHVNRLDKINKDYFKSMEDAIPKDWSSRTPTMWTPEQIKKAEEDAEKIAELQKKLKDEFRNYIQSFGQDFFSNAGFGETFDFFLRMDEDGKTMFDKLDSLADGSREKFAATFLAISESAQEAFNFIAELSKKNYEDQYARIEKEKEIALAFAGDSDTAKAEIERQAEERRKQIARREFKAKKEQAIFNIAIDTSQAIMSTYAKSGFPAGLPLALIMGALGLAQIALVNSQQIPAYKEGTDNHSGGVMLVNDGSGSNYKETIQTPDGKIYQPKERNVLMNAPKGTKVFTHEQWKNNLDNMLLSNNINYSMPIINNNSALTESQVDRIVNTIANKQEAILNIDKNGWNTSIRNGHSTKQILNNQVTFGR